MLYTGTKYFDCLIKEVEFGELGSRTPYFKCYKFNIEILIQKLCNDLQIKVEIYFRP